MLVQEKQLRMYSTEKTFFSKLTKSITKLFLPNKVGINSFMISIKRNNLLKSFGMYNSSINDKDMDKETIKKKYEDMYVLYLESIDKHVIDSMYKRVKNNTADDFEKTTLSKYYSIAQIKDKDIVEYKCLKQKFLIDLDYETILLMDKPNLLENYKKFYIEKVEALYKKLLKNYSIKLADVMTIKSKEEVYKNIFKILEDYISNILPEKMKNNEEKYDYIKEDYDKLEKYTVGKLDKCDIIAKKIILLGISRNIFTHSLPLVVSEKCYIKLLKETRTLIEETMNPLKRDKVYNLLLTLIEQYNLKVLSTKIYWDKPDERQKYKEFWKEYQEIQKLEDEQEKFKKKQILFVREDLRKVYQKEKTNKKIIIFYKCKLIALGAMKNLKNSCKTMKLNKKVEKKKVTK